MIRKVLNLQVGQTSLQVKRPHLKRWLALEQIRTKISVEADKIDLILAYLVASTGYLEWDNVSWYDTIRCFQEVLVLNEPGLKLPFLQIKTRKDEKIPWDYPERIWYSFAHLLASKYGWSLEYIAGMLVDDALALIQEILVDQQLRREWEWSLTEIAYPYNSGTKKQEFKSLPRPAWMMIQQNFEIKKMKMPRGMMPMGAIIGQDKLDEAVESKTSKIVV